MNKDQEYDCTADRRIVSKNKIITKLEHRPATSRVESVRMSKEGLHVWALSLVSLKGINYLPQMVNSMGRCCFVTDDRR